MRFIFLIVLLALPAQARKFALPPQLNSMNEMGSFLMYLADEVPWLFMEGAEYDVNFVNLLERQNRIVGELNKHGDYQSILNQRSALIEIEAQLVVDTNEKIRSPKAELNRALATEHDDHVEHIAEILNQLSTRNPSSIVTGLINCLPRDQRANLFSLELTSQIERLAQNESLTDESIRQSFRGESVGLRTHELNKSDLLARARRGQVLEMQFLALALHFARQTNPQQSLSSLINDVSWVRTLDWQGLEVTALQKLVNSALRNNTEVVREKAEVGAHTFYLREVPPYLGAFRGVVGADCATSHSMASSYFPHEYTFFIYDENKSPVGYAQATAVRGPDGPHLYLHDVTGSRLSVKLMEQTIFALKGVAGDLGYQSVDLPTADRITRNNNYFPLRERQIAMIADQRAIDITYLDSSFRSLFSTQSLLTNSTYDMPSANSKAFSLDHLTGPKMKLKVSKRDKPLQLESLDRKSALLLFLVWNYGEHSPSAQRALHLAWSRADLGRQSSFDKRSEGAKKFASEFGFDLARLQSLSQALQNPQGEPLAQLSTNLTAQMNELGVTLTSEEWAKFEFLTYEGRMLASDAFTASPHESIQHSIWLLKRWPEPPQIKAALERNPEVFANSNRFQAYLRSLAVGEENKLEQLTWLLHSGVSPLWIEAKTTALEELVNHPLVQVRNFATSILQKIKQAQRESELSCAG